jgi:MEMO1 family protein
MIAPAFACFDGEHTLRDLQTAMTRQAGRIVLTAEVERLVDALRENGFLEGDEFEQIRRARHAEFASAETREAIHAGSAYPEHSGELDETIDSYYKEGGAERSREAPDHRIGIAAPHVSPFGGANAYTAAYARIVAEHREKTFVILGTSHYGDPDKFGLTRKAFLTPYGRAEVDTQAVDFIAQRAPSAVIMEDYCHSIEHSIEFQVVFLQHALRTPIRILPILCGPFMCDTDESPESEPNVRAFIEALRALDEARGEELFYVLGIDLAHMGARYGDGFAAVEKKGRMSQVEARDRKRLERVCAGDAGAFFELAHCANDELKWCGTVPIYTFLRSVSGAKAELLQYQQWNIDPQSVVTFAGLELVRG